MRKAILLHYKGTRRPFLVRHEEIIAVDYDVKGRNEPVYIYTNGSQHALDETFQVFKAKMIAAGSEFFVDAEEPGPEALPQTKLITD